MVEMYDSVYVSSCRKEEDRGEKNAKQKKTRGRFFPRSASAPMILAMILTHRKAQQQAALAHARVANEEQLEEQVIFGVDLCRGSRAVLGCA